MEVVRVFNNELSSLYEVRPPISKAKMTQITKSAIKGLKFYKHIVQSVEKFIQKCRPEYKVPGLYVVDSIVRQSRHQFGADKDVFGPRFVKNINITFQHLFKCAEDDRPKIIRVLNLWQKNAVFPSEIIQPLLDMGHPNSNNEWPLDVPAEPSSKDNLQNKVGKEESKHKTSDSWKEWPQSNEEPVQDNKTYAEMSTKNLEKFTKAEMSNALKEDESSRSNLHRNQEELPKPPEETVKFNKKLLDFDYGDEEDEDDVKNEESHLSTQPNALALSMAQNLLSNPELLRQLQQMAASTIQQPEPVKDMTQTMKMDDNEAAYPQDMQSSPQHSLIPPTCYQQPVMPYNLQLSNSETDIDDRVLPEPPLPPRDLDERSLASVMASHDRLLPSMCLPPFQQTGVAPKPPLPDKDDRIIPDPSLVPRDLDERSLASIIAPADRAIMPPLPYPDNSNIMQYQYDKNGIPFPPQPGIPTMDSMNMNAIYPPIIQPDQHLLQNSQTDEDERMMYSMPGEPPLPPQDFDERQIILPEERSRKERSRSRSGSRSRGRSGRHRSRSRSPRRKRSRSRSRSRKNRSRSRERERIREKERERERERERRRKGIPPIKKGCISVCSTTLWLGHVPKACSESDISKTFITYGEILTIDMIPPRGCAYVVMDRRQDGHRALQKLKNLKLNGSSIKLAWAPGKGVKGKEFKEYWEVEHGVSYIPYDKFKDDLETLEFLEEGGFIDEDSLPDHLKILRKQAEEEKHSFNNNSNSSNNNKTAAETNPTFSEMQTAPSIVPPPIIPPTSVGLPMVLPHLMTPQFGLHLPGMLPPQAMVMQVPMGIPPPAPMLMVQQQSQGVIGNQPLSIVGGVPQMVPGAIPPSTTALPNMKSLVSSDLSHLSSVIPPSTTNNIASNTVGDATPTEEDGTSVSSPSIQMTTTGSVSASSLTVSSAQPIASMAQFNAVLGLTGNRPMLSVPPPVSTAGTPIPYPPPNVGFNFPPPGIRPPGQSPGMPPNPQFPWMQKQVGSPFTDADSGHSGNSTPIRPTLPPQSGMPLHLFGNRPPFHDPQVSNMNPASMQESRKERENTDQKTSDGDNSDNRILLSGSHDKLAQEMVMSTDDESSMDVEYSRGDMPPGPYFPGVPDFRAPLNMQRMRSPLGPMQPGPRFPRGMHMGSPFPMRMGSPRGMGGPGMHNRMEMEFSPHHGPRGPRMGMPPHGPRRNEMYPPHDGRDWYPRDFEGPPYERDRHYRDDWGRDQWAGPGEAENDPRRNTRDHEEGRRDNYRDSWERDHIDNLKPVRDPNSANDKNERNESNVKPPERSTKAKSSKNFSDDLLKLRFYQRNSSSRKEKLTDQPKDKSVQKEKRQEKDTDRPTETDKEQPEIVKDSTNDQNVASKREREREYRKKSRWGRTLSEEREFQQQKRNEIEMKFQSYEQSHAAQQPVQSDTDIPPNQISDDTPMETAVLPVENVSELSGISSTDPPSENPINSPSNNSVNALDQNLLNTSMQETINSCDQNSTNPSESDHIDSIERDSTSSFEQNSSVLFEKEASNVSLSNNNESCQNPEIYAQPVMETPVENVVTSLAEKNELTDFQTSTDLNTDISQTKSEYSSSVIDNFSHEANLADNDSAQTQSVNDLSENGGVSNCTFNENEISGEVNSNNSPLVSTES